MSDVTVSEIVKTLSNSLEIVDLSGCNKITDAGFKQVKMYVYI